MNILGVTIKKLREEKGYTQLELAKKANIGSGTLGDIESGRNKSTVKTIDKISKALELTESEKNKLDNAFMGRKLKTNIVIKNSINLIEIPVYVSVSAGCGRIPEREPIDYISLPEVTSDCIAIKVEGESMEPTLSPGDLIVLKKEMEVNIGDIGVFLNKTTGESFVKRLKNKNGNYILESDNSLFSDIEINTDEICCCGKVINIVKNNLKKKIDPIYEKLELLDINQQKIIEMMIESLLEKNKK